MKINLGTRKLQKLGNAFYINLPKVLLSNLQAKNTDSFDILIDSDTKQVIIEKNETKQRNN